MKGDYVFLGFLSHHYIEDFSCDICLFSNKKYEGKYAIVLFINLQPISYINIDDIRDDNFDDHHEELINMCKTLCETGNYKNTNKNINLVETE